MAKPRERVLCECADITEAQVKDALNKHPGCTFKELIRLSGAGKFCTACHPSLRRLMDPRDATSK
jgi:bacterioferritin-associated ferredoxin